MDHQSHEPARFWYYYDFSPLQPGRYYCGDCFQLLPAIESGTVDMVLIDPPYYMGKDKAWDCFEGRADYMAFMGRAFIQAQRILKENGTLGFWHNDLQKITWLCDWLERNTDMRFATWGIWVKPNHRRKIWVNPGPGNTLRSWFNIQNHGYRNEMLPNGTHLCIPKEVQDFVLAWTETILNPWVMPKKKQKEIA